MRLADFVRPDLVALDLAPGGVRETLATLVYRLREAGAIPEDAPVEEVLREREAAHTTAMGNGVAVPHAGVPGLERPVVMVGVAPEGTSYGPAGSDPVHLFFLVLSPPQEARAHIKLLARIARLLRHPGFVRDLQQADTPERVVEAIARVDAEHL